MTDRYPYPFDISADPSVVECDICGEPKIVAGPHQCNAISTEKLMETTTQMFQKRLLRDNERLLEQAQTTDIEYVESELMKRATANVLQVVLSL